MLATSMCGLMILATDTLIATAFLHTCGHFEILKENFKQLNSGIHGVRKIHIRYSSDEP